MITINGRQYPLWSHFVERKNEWVGGVLEDFGDPQDRRMFGGDAHGKTKITDIRLDPNGKEGAYFTVAGEDFGCGFSTEVGGIMAGEDGWLTFSGYGGARVEDKTTLTEGV